MTESRRMRVTHTINGRTVLFEWHGGAYITIFVDGKPVEVINVWHSSSDTPTIERSDVAFREHVEKWLTDGKFEADLRAGNYA